MTKKLRRFIAAALTVALAAGIGITTLSANNSPTVTLNGTSRAFEFSNTDSGTDLFPGMKGVMPGDTITQDIIVRTTNISGQRAQISLKVVPASGEVLTDMNKLLESKDVKLEVYQGATKLADGSLADGVSLGQLANNQSLTLAVKLVIDKAAGNEIAGLNGKIDWVFYGEVTGGGGGGGGGGGSGEVVIPEEGVPLGPLPKLEKVDHYAYIIGRDDGLIHPGANITRAEMATIFFRMLTDASRAEQWSQTNDYTDMAANAWYNNAISTLTKAGVLTGHTDGSFAPNAPITRAEFAAMLSRFYEAKYEGPSKFSDIEGHWAADSINKAAMNNLLKGYPDGTFKPNNYISRAEAVTGINRILDRVPQKEHLLPNMITWPDNSDTGAWYYEAMQEATNSHNYEMVMNDSAILYEKWTELREVRDWAALEKAWSKLLGNQTEIISQPLP